MDESRETLPPPQKKVCLEDEEGSGEESNIQDEGGSQNETSAVDAPLNAPFVRIKRKKFALLLSYNGKDYKGMQWLVQLP